LKVQRIAQCQFAQNVVEQSKRQRGQLHRVNAVLLVDDVDPLSFEFCR